MAVAEPQTKVNTDFKPGDTVSVHYKIVEAGKTRIQPFTGIVISKRGEGISKTFTVRRVDAGGIGIERIFPLFSPNIEKIELISTGKVRRAKLYYLRDRVGKQATKIKAGKARATSPKSQTPTQEETAA